MHPPKKLMQGQTVKYQTEILMSLQRPLAVCLFAVFADLIHFFGSFFTVHCAEWPARLVFSPEIKKS